MLLTLLILTLSPSTAVRTPRTKETLTKKAMASTLATTPLRRAGAAAPSRGAAQVARVVRNKKALSYDSSWKKVRV
jgi:hypothetical protein